MKLTLDGTTYESRLLELFTMSIGEARIIKRQTGLTIADWQDGVQSLDRVDPDVFVSLVYLLKSRAGETVDWDELDALPVMAVIQGLDFELTDEDRAEMATQVVEEAERARDSASPTDPPPPATE